MKWFYIMSATAQIVSKVDPPIKPTIASREPRILVHSNTPVIERTTLCAIGQQHPKCICHFVIIGVLEKQRPVAECRDQDDVIIVPLKHDAALLFGSVRQILVHSESDKLMGMVEEGMNGLQLYAISRMASIKKAQH